MTDTLDVIGHEEFVEGLDSKKNIRAFLEDLPKAYQEGMMADDAEFLRAYHGLRYYNFE